MTDFDTVDIAAQVDAEERIEERDRAHKAVCRRVQSVEDYLELTGMLGLDPLEV